MLATMSGMVSTVSPTNRQTTTQVVEPCLLTDAEKETVSAELIRWPSDCNITLTGPSTSEILPYFDFGNPRFASIDHRNQQYSIYAISMHGSNIADVPSRNAEPSGSHAEVRAARSDE